MDLINIEDLRAICTPENFFITIHAAERLKQRGMALEDIINSVLHGEIIEQYPTDYPLPSCLILGKTVDQETMHVVIGSDLLTMWIVTAYKPDKEKWDESFRTRKES